jgi:deazaflavin-dependent oxidoreductase (nitroreductase family)
MSVRRSNKDKFLDGVRIFNKYIFNRFILIFASRGIGPFSIVTHIGRKSAREYRTPVLATYSADKIIIPLSYGEHVDWFQNVLAKGGCRIRFKGEDISARDPMVHPAQDVLHQLPENRRSLFERYKLEKYLVLLRD